MDEPTNGLDIPSKSQFRKTIASALTDDKCIIISTHQVRDLENLIDSVLILNDHQITVSASLDDIAQRLKFGVVSSDTPYIYGEEALNGIRAITQNTSDGYSKIDLELLFNAAVAQNNQLAILLK